MQKIIDEDLLAFMGEQESQFLIKPSNLYDQLIKRRDNDESIKILNLPWSKTNPYVKLREGEVSLWCGISGHGKSTLLGQVAAWGLKQKWLIASMEMLPESTVERMVKQISGKNEPDNETIKNILNFMDRNLWLYDQTDTVKSERILALIRYAKTLGINHIIIDSLMKCGIGKDNLEGQAAFIDKLCWLAKTTRIHIHLVHHTRKTESEKRVPDKFDVRGAAEIVDQVDNVFIVHRNKSKEEDQTGDYVDQPDCFLRCAKQRHFSWEGTFGLWFDKPSNQYVADAHRIMTHWINYQGEKNVQPIKKD